MRKNQLLRSWADALETRRFNRRADMEQTLLRYVARYDHPLASPTHHPLAQSALGSKTPMQAMKFCARAAGAAGALRCSLDAHITSRVIARNWRPDRTITSIQSCQGLDDGLRVPLDHIEQHQRRTVRGTVAALPMPQGCRGKTKAGGELFFSHPYLGAHGLHVDGARTMYAHAALITPGMGYGLLQALFDALECGAHDVFPLQISTNTSTKSASVASRIRCRRLRAAIGAQRKAHRADNTERIGKRCNAAMRFDGQRRPTDDR